MDDIDRGFLKEVFEEVNAHIRATDRKSLLVSGAYISLFAVFLSSVANGRWSNNAEPTTIIQIGVQVFFLAVGTCIFVMQQWYRAWKEHYIDVCVEIRKVFMPSPSTRALIPYWMRDESRESKISIDNLLKYLSLCVNFLLVFLICYELMKIVEDIRLACLVIAAIIVIYCAIILASYWAADKERKLDA